MILRGVVRAELKPREDGGFDVVLIDATRARQTVVVDDDSWALKPGYRLSVSMDIEHDGTGLKVSFSRRRFRRKFRPVDNTVEDGTTSDWESTA